MKRRIILATGGCDPVHAGHIAYFEAAKQLGDYLIVGVNSDSWLTRKKGRPFMDWQNRAAIVSALRPVDMVIDFNDDDGSARDAIRKVRALYPNATIVFVNGGDRTSTNIPEMDYVDPDLEFAFGVGGDDKKNSSSWILSDWKAPKTNRTWGYYRVIHEYGIHTKIKELTVDPGSYLSMQRHQNRAEFWFVAKGTASVYTLENNVKVKQGVFNEHEHIWITKCDWHQLANETDQPLQIVEIQYGTDCNESDIERI